MSSIKETIDSLGLDETAREVREELISGTLNKYRSGISQVEVPEKELEEKAAVISVKPKYDKLEIADTARDIYRKNINPVDKKEVEAHTPVATPDTIAQRQNVIALSRALAGLRSSGNEGKTSPVGPNGVGNLGKLSPTGENGTGNIGTNTVSGNYYALTTDMTLEQYQDHVNNIFEGKACDKCGKPDCGCDETPYEKAKKVKDPATIALETDKKLMKIHNEDMVLDFEQRLRTLGSDSWIEVDQLLRELAEEYDVRPKDLSKAFKDHHGMYPDKWIKENRVAEVCGLMPLEEAARINRVGQVYDVTFMFRGGTQRLKFFWPQVGRPTRSQMQNACELFWPKARLITFYPSIEDAANKQQMVMVPPSTDNYVALHKEHWDPMSEEDSQIFYTICEEEGEPLGSPELNEDGTYQVHIADHDTGEERVVHFGEAAYPGHDEQGKPLPKKDKRMEINKADINLPAGKNWMKGDPRYKAAKNLGQD